MNNIAKEFAWSFCGFTFNEIYRMSRNRSSQPTEVELRILRELWSQGASTCRAVHNAISLKNPTNYSTTVKMLSVMLDKGLVKRDESVSPHRYRPAKQKKTTQRGMLKDLVQKAFDGSTSNLVLQALSSKKASQEELSEIRQLLDELESGKS